jgi:hypothetical protein
MSFLSGCAGFFMMAMNLALGIRLFSAGRF